VTDAHAIVHVVFEENSYGSVTRGSVEGDFKNQSRMSP
jgi:hypothetical protein